MQISPFSNNLILSNRRTHQEFSFGNNKYFPKKDYSIGENIVDDYFYKTVDEDTQKKLKLKRD